MILSRALHRVRQWLSRRWWQLALTALALLLVADWFLPPLPSPRFLERWPAADTGFTPWKPLFPGIDYACACFSKPRPMKCHVVRIELARPGISLLAGAPGRSLQAGTASGFVSAFVRSQRVQVAINTTPFTPERVVPGLPVNVQGLAVSQGVRLSPAAGNLDSLVITRGNRARLVPAGGDTADAWNGLGGFLITLRGGTNVAEILPPEPATVIGLSHDGRRMFWLVVDGRQPGYSEGATARETAEILRRLGATEALNLDGGGSSTLACAGGWRGVRVLNRPYHWVWNGLQRPVGAVLGVRSQPAQ
ncbi:MAG TPA: phosphodiester glycosidase family protein [Candidatus Limnocylindria bacterium]|jgi:hypothetical protein|nr:phosphodiester glycosidase family protein [Candidatus Limnocylindria bacterium]